MFSEIMPSATASLQSTITANGRWTEHRLEVHFATPLRDPSVVKQQIDAYSEGIFSCEVLPTAARVLIDPALDQTGAVSLAQSLIRRLGYRTPGLITWPTKESRH